MASRPARVVDLLCAYWETSAFVAAIDLGVFTALGRRALTSAELARACRADRTSLARLCRTLVPLGVLRMRRGRFRASSEMARFLDERSPDFIGPAHRFLAGPPMQSAFANLAATVRRGRPRRSVAANPSVWRDFAEATAGLRQQVARDIAAAIGSRGLARKRILDVGAGASPLGLQLLRRDRTATLVVIDRPSVVRVALDEAARRGVAGRVSGRGGDARTIAWGGPYDLVVMINVLDYLSASGRASLLRRAHAALVPGGALVIHAPLLGRRGVSPPEAVASDLMLLALGASGRASTVAEMRTACRAAGFSSVGRWPGLPLVIARRRRARASAR